MNICVVTKGYPTPIDPGRYAFVDQLVCTWADMGNEVTVIYPIPILAELKDKTRFYKSKWERKTLNQRSISVICPRYFSASDKAILGIKTGEISYKSLQNALINTIKNMDTKPDVLYGHFLSSGCQVGDVGYKLQIPSFCAFGESTLWSIEGENIEKIKKSLSQLKGIVSVSTENKRILVEKDLFRERDIKIFPNGVDHSTFYRRDKNTVRKKNGIPEYAFVGAFVGSFNDDKGVLRAQKAAIKEDILMIYIGGGIYKPEGSNIIYCGKLSHEKIPEFLSAADFFILPTKAEGCCNAIIEAMACGLPIISAKGAYNDDILSEEYSIRTDPMDIDAMADAIRMLRDDPERRRIMSEAASNASLKYDIIKRAEAILDFMKRKTQKG